ncbi:UNKNOWN [Stylonychia lemnae]|uniref:Uncharacterized protein n=1 Tax=Stylonychia lemnae TaxID=5949 RepID=A0A078B0S8_STYLE|nr:UNKNOWN [Stylonychia lemnae]|eukprot:CDW88159.1 UNKNOWN [Stylonychia lemnae]
MQIDDFNLQLLKIVKTKSNLTELSISNGINLNSLGLAINAIDSNIEISRSQFQDLKSLGGSSILHRSSLDEMVVYNLTLIQSNFTRGLALDKGGHILIDNSNLFINESLLEYGNNFTENEAGKSGGGIFYDLYRPINLENNLYLNNSAQYGNDFASYGYKLKILNQDTTFLSQLISGGLLSSKSLQLGIFDQDQQLINTDNKSQLFLSSYSDGLSVSGNTLFEAVKGIFYVKDVLLVGQPSSKFQIKALTPNGIDVKSIKQFDQNFDSALIISLRFRECYPGEVLIENKCFQCIKGTYSLSVENQTCKPCPVHIKCDGGNLTLVDNNFWRSSTNTIQVYQCPKVDVCLQFLIQIIFKEEDNIQNVRKDMKENCALNVLKIQMENIMQEALTHKKTKEKQSSNPFVENPYKLLPGINDGKRVLVKLALKSFNFSRVLFYWWTRFFEDLII